MELSISLDTIISIIGIVIPLVGSIYWLARKLDRIEDNTEPIKSISETMIRLDERTRVLSLGGKSPGTVNVQLTHYGNVSVTAQPFSDVTRYTVIFGAPAKLDGISRVAKQTGLVAKEEQLFGGQHATGLVVNPNYLVITVPSTNPALCSEYMTYFLKWLDTEYFPRAEATVAEYENIKL